MKFIAAYEGKIPGTNKIECGNYLEHDLAGAKKEAAAMIPVLEGWTPAMMEYKE
jgi:S-ribosylhomocysteine lyase